MIVDTYKTLFLFNEPLTWYALPYFRSLSMKSICRTLASFRTTGVTLIEPIFQRLLINYSLRFHCHILGISKVTNYSVLNHFNKFSLEHLLNHKYYRPFSKACLEIPKLLPSFEKDTFVTCCFEIYISCSLFSTIKGWVISDQTILNLQEWVLVNEKSFQVQI